jgi:hypothetical protein
MGVSFHVPHGDPAEVVAIPPWNPPEESRRSGGSRR